MLGNFEEKARKVLLMAKKEMKELKHPYVSSEHLLLSILKDDNEVTDKLKDYDLTYDIVKNEIIKIIGIGSKESDYLLYTPLLRRIIENASVDAKENNNGVVTVNHLFSSLLEEGEGVAIRILMGMNIDVDDLYSEFAYRVVSRKNGKKLLLDELGVDLNKKALSGLLDPITGRDKEIKRVMEILSRRTKNNPLLIGDAGVGKTAIVEALASKIVSGDIPLSLKNKRIINLDMSSCVAGTKYRGEFEERINKLLKEIEDNDDIILFIDEIHTIVGAGGAEGAIDASNIFKPALARGTLRCIGATTTLEYKKFIEKDSALERRFQKVEVKQPSKQTVMDILYNLREIYGAYHKVMIDDDIIGLITNLSEKYIYNRQEPDRSIDVLDEVCARASLKENKNLIKYKEYNNNLKTIIDLKKRSIIDNDFDKASEYKAKEFKLMNEINSLELNLYKENYQKVTKLDVASVINDKTGIPIYEILGEKKEIIKNTESKIRGNIVGQNDVIKKVCRIAKKIKLGLHGGCYSMLFCGPSGVGKTMLAKQFGKNLVGKENVIKIDCSEYKEPHSISKIIGAPPGYVGYNDNANILEEIRNKPYSVLILDEIEKAHDDIVNLFLQILDEGKIKNSKGKTVRFDNVVIILTSNVGFCDGSVGFKKEKKIFTKLNDKFSIPFMNRVDNVIVFDHLSDEDVLKIVNSTIKKLKDKYKGKINIRISKKVALALIDKSNYEEYGARKVRKVIRDQIESQIIEALLENKKGVFIKELQTV
ncbi:MAG: ATP-dependent Clp protease ATP-binding subunit [Bacilli bacterium]|nr:ATP-dependent Clp protease ATP-binding subunit [Bacilli bacterium]